MGHPVLRQVRPARRVRGRVRVPGDKSISHRLLILGALAEGVTVVDGLSTGDDCASTRACLRGLGVEFADVGGADGSGLIRVTGCGRRRLAAPLRDLDAGNSGTTARLLMGVLAGLPLEATLTGDASLRRRPMQRVIDPLASMGAAIRSTDGRLPVSIEGRALHGIDYTLPVASAQVKSAVLLAGLGAEGVTRLVEPQPTRDHTEVALTQFGATVTRSGGSIELRGGQALHGVRAHVPGDPSSAACWAAAAAGVPGSFVEIEGVALNPTRTGFADLLARMGAEVELVREDDGRGEAYGTLRVSHAAMRAVEVGAAEVPRLIDELPVLAALATHGGGLTVRGAGELRLKESDRISALVAGLRALGATADEFPDGFTIDGTRRVRGGTADAAGDHRLAMAFAIAALGAERPSTIVGADAVSVSYPEFFDTLDALTA